MSRIVFADQFHAYFKNDKGKLYTYRIVQLATSPFSESPTFSYEYLSGYDSLHNEIWLSVTGAMKAHIDENLAYLYLQYLVAE